MRSSCLVRALAAIACVALGTAHADEDPASEPARLRPIIVVGSPTDAFESEVDTTGFTQVIDAREAWRGYRTVGELLEHAVGVQVRHFGAREDFATISVRGSTPNQVKVLLDGVSLSRAQNDLVNLADIPMDAVERIEVYRGFTPVRMASSGAASVVNIITRADAAGDYGVSLTYGSFDTAKATVHAGERLGPGTLTGFLTYRHTDGDFTFKDDTPDPIDNPAGQTVERRRINNDLDSVDVLLRYVLPLADKRRVTLSGNGYYKDEGTPGPASDQQPLARFEQGRAILAAAFDSGTGTNLSADFTYLGETVRDPKDPDADIPGLGRPPKADNTTLAFATAASTSHAIGEHHLIEGGVEAAYEQFDGRFDDPGAAEPLPERTQRRGRLALALGDDVYVSSWNLVISPQVRYEGVWNGLDGEALYPPIPDDDLPSGHDSSVDPRLGLRWEPLAGLSFKGNVGTYFRPPTFGELFGDDGFTSANPSLGPESGVNRDVGLLWTLGGPGRLRSLSLEYAYFDNEVDDMIVFIASGNRIPRPQNVGEARVRGHELRFDAAGPLGLSLESNYTHQRAENRTPIPEFHGKDLPSLPRDELYARLAVDREHWSLAYALQYRSSVFLDQANLRLDERVPAHTTHGLTLELRPFSREFTVAIEATNISDEQVSDVVGFPAPGRAFYLTLSYAGRRANEE